MYLRAKQVSSSQELDLEILLGLVLRGDVAPLVIGIVSPILVESFDLTIPKLPHRRPESNAEQNIDIQISSSLFHWYKSTKAYIQTKENSTHYSRPMSMDAQNRIMMDNIHSYPYMFCPWKSIRLHNLALLE